MLAAVVEKPGRLVVKDVPKPKIDDNSYLIKVEAASICNATDNHIVEGIFDGYHDFYPQILGHEVCGTVVEMGKNISKRYIGERVALYTPNGAFAEYVRVDGSRGAHIQDNMSSEVACSCEPFDGAYTCMVAPAELTEHDSVLIIGAGPLGLAAMGTASLHTKKIYVVDFYKNRLDLALEMGASHVYDRSVMSVDDILEALKKDAEKIDVTFMCIALDRSKELDAFHLAIEATRYNGRISGLNVEVKLDHHNHRLNPFHMNRKNIKYRHMLERDAREEDFQYAFDQVAAGKIPMEKTITHKFCLDELEKALDITHNHLDQCVKIVIYPRLSKK
ncbi:MAG: alcohol dehydrogenase catalytic domain-containing protein [Oscillospiraceae bacterium]|nr:alcohol dehydrogenase catalytic domain-containing protein [Oscillospiraceae bacterium]